MLPLYLAGFVLIFYFLLLRPQRQQEQKRRAMIDALKKNDKVLTTGGIYGTVTSVDAASDRVVLRIDDEKGVKVAFSRSSVARVLEPAAEKPAES
jgi:preprotein translocase subunit YajC